MDHVPDTRQLADDLLRGIGAAAVAVGVVWLLDRWVGWDPVAYAERIVRDAAGGEPPPRGGGAV